MSVSRLALAASTGALAVLLAPLEPFAAPAQPLIRPVAGTSREIPGDAGRVRVRFPMEIREGVRPRLLRVAILSVGAGGRGDRGLYSAFSVRLLPERRGHGPALLVSIVIKPFVRPGTYVLVVGIVKRGQRPERQRLTLRIVLPAAALAQPRPLIIQRIGLWSFPDRDDAGLRLHETSRRSRLDNLVIEQVDQARNGDRVETGTIVFDNPENVAPGRVGVVDYVLEGHFGLGTAAGTLQIDSPRLTAPIAVPFEVRTRRESWLILLIAFVGLASGGLARVVLQRRIERGEALRTAENVRAELDLEATRVDILFRDDLARARKQLAPAFHRFARASDIQAAVTSAAETLANARRKLDEQRRKAQAEQNSLASILEKEWAVPPQVAEALKQAGEAAGKAGELLGADNVGGALREQKSAGKSLRRANSAGREWREQALVSLETLADETGNPNELATPLKRAVAAATEAVDAIPTEPEVEPQRVLAQLHKAVLAVNALLRGLSTIEQTVRSVKLVLERKGVDTGSLDRAHASFEQELGDLTRIAEVGSAFRGVLEALTETISATVDDPDAVRDLLEQGRYAQAAQIAVAKRKIVTRQPSVVLQAEVERAAAVAALASATAEAAAATAPLPGMLVPVLASHELPPRTDVYVTSWRTLLTARLLQWLILALGFLILSYALFADDFVGTYEDFATVFFWAFALDVTGNTLLEGARGLPRRPATPSSPAGA